jgi:hypothetical protein
MKAKVLYGAWLLFRHLGIAALAVVTFPLLTAVYYVVASVAGGHTNDEQGDLAMTIPFAGAAFLIGCLFTFLMLFPAMLVSDSFRLFKGRRRWATLVPGLVTVLLAFLPWQLTAARGFSVQWFLIGTAFLFVVFSLYWGACQSVDFLAEKIFSFIRKKLQPQT